MWPFKSKGGNINPEPLCLATIRIPENLSARKRKKLVKMAGKFTETDYKGKRLNEFFFCEYLILSKDFFKTSMINPMRTVGLSLFFRPKHQQKIMKILGKFNIKVSTLRDVTDNVHADWSSWMQHLLEDGAEDFLLKEGVLQKDKRFKKMHDCPDCGDDVVFDTNGAVCYNCGFDLYHAFFDIRQMCLKAAVNGGKYEVIKRAA